MTSAQFHAPRRARNFLDRLRRDENGFTAVEFGIVAVPFLMMLFGIINVGLLYFTSFSIENATENAARFIRTGQAKTNAWSQSQFKTEVCNRVPTFVDCASKLRVDVRVVPEGTAPTPPPGTSGGALVSDAQTQYQNSAGGDIVMVTAFYQWDLAKYLPFLQIGNMGDGSRLVQATVAFKNEPFN